MRLESGSAWEANLVQASGVVVRFDTPRCALLAWKSGDVSATSVRLHEFYDRTWRSGDELRFAVGSDVVGPMGPDAVPVDPSRAEKFARDHHAARVIGLGELTVEVLRSLP